MILRPVARPLVVPASRQFSRPPAAIGGGVPLVFGWNPEADGGPVLYDTGGRRAYTETLSSRIGVRALQGRSSGKWYFEMTMTSVAGQPNSVLGLAKGTWNTANVLGSENTGFGVSTHGHAVYYNGANSGMGAMGNPVASTASAVSQVAVDLDTGEFWFGVNGAWKYSGNPAAGTGEMNITVPAGEWYPAMTVESQAALWGVTLHDRATDQTYTPPSGFTPWAGG